jgi:hypothetical protein
MWARGRARWKFLGVQTDLPRRREPTCQSSGSRTQQTTRRLTNEFTMDGGRPLPSLSSLTVDQCCTREDRSLPVQYPSTSSSHALAWAHIPLIWCDAGLFAQYVLLLDLVAPPLHLSCLLPAVRSLYINAAAKLDLNVLMRVGGHSKHRSGCTRPFVRLLMVGSSSDNRAAVRWGANGYQHWSVAILHRPRVCPGFRSASGTAKSKSFIDIQEKCGDADKIGQCAMEKRASLSQPCQTVIDTLRNTY